VHQVKPLIARGRAVGTCDAVDAVVDACVNLRRPAHVPREDQVKVSVAVGVEECRRREPRRVRVGGQGAEPGTLGGILESGLARGAPVEEQRNATDTRHKDVLASVGIDVTHRDTRAIHGD